MNKPEPVIEYVPPKEETIRVFARSVCEELAKETNDPIYLQSHVIRGLACFIEIAARPKQNTLVHSS
jgi:hypothetical protein